MRLLAAVLVMALFSYMGYSKVWVMKHRWRLLAGFAKDINCLCEELRMRPRDMESMVERFFGEERGEFWQLFEKGVVSFQRAEDAWNGALSGFSGTKVLEPDEIILMQEAGVGIGTKSMQLQLKYMEASAKAIAARAEEVKLEISKKGGMYGRLGLLAGAAAALIII